MGALWAHWPTQWEPPTQGAGEREGVVWASCPVTAPDRSASDGVRGYVPAPGEGQTFEGSLTVCLLFEATTAPIRSLCSAPPLLQTLSGSAVHMRAEAVGTCRLPARGRCGKTRPTASIVVVVE